MDDDDRYDDRDRRARRRENLMQQRLRKSRGEEIDEEINLPNDDDDDDRPRVLGGGYGGGNYRGGGGSSGCAQATLYLVLGALAALLIGAFLLNQTLGGIGRLFQAPDVAAIISTPTPAIISGAAVIQRIQQLSRLETASYTIETVIDVRQGSNIPIVGDFLASDELLLIAHGTVVAGVDLGSLPPSAVEVSPDGSSITLRLPPAQIFSAALDSQKTRVYSRERGVFAPENKDLETQARQVAEQQILQSACEDGILSRAGQEAQVSLQQFLGLLEFERVEVIAAAPAACAAPAAAPAATPLP